MNRLSSKLCECGCGQHTKIASHTSHVHGIIKGEPNRYVQGHNSPYIASRIKGKAPWNKGMTGEQIWGSKENHPRYKSDRNALAKSGDAEKDRRSSAYVLWRRAVWLRDKFTCKIANPDCAGRIEAHHILGYKDYPELRYQVNNGITLCHFHHPRTRKEEKRLSPYFQEIVSASKETI